MGKLLRHDRDDDEPQLWDLDCLGTDNTENLHDRKTGTSTTKYERLGKLCDLLNSLDHEELPLQIERDGFDQRGTATAENPQFSARPHVTLLLVHTVRDDKHLGPEDNEGKQRKARKTSLRSLTHKRVSTLEPGVA